jgi:serine/threonine-protein kinase
LKTSNKISYKRRKGVLPHFLILICFFLLIFLISILLDKLIIPSFIHDKKIVKIPKLIGKTIEEARFELEANNLSFQISSEQYTQKYEPEIIINQNPKPYSKVKEGRRIYLTVSKGQVKTAVPYLVGKTLRTAYLLLSEKGLSIGDTLYEFSELYMRDTIISQSIKAGEPAPVGSFIDIVVSKGSMYQVEVPQLIGKNIHDAESLILRFGLIVGNISSIRDNTYISNTVIDQNPKAGIQVQQGTQIHLLISKDNE